MLFAQDGLGLAVDRAPIRSPSTRCDLSIVIPTRNERDNLPELLRRLSRALPAISWQAIVVDDDSPDDTVGQAKGMAALDSRVVCLRRVGRRGLAGAVIEGVMASSAPYVAVLDADLQHDERLLLGMFEDVRSGRSDVAVATRILDFDAACPGLSRPRRAASRFANNAARRLLGSALSDPMSGFFLTRRDIFDAAAPRLSPFGFKILFDLLATYRGPLRVVEVPYVFRPRLTGGSKLDARASAEFAALLLAKVSGDLLSPRTVLFCAVGGTGLIVHLLTLRAALSLGFTEAQGLAALTAMTSNFLINNALTYRDRSLRGLRLLGGYLQFCLLCAVGLSANLAVATVAAQHLAPWWAAGVAGALVGAAWNFVSTAAAVW